MNHFSDKVNLIWDIADTLRGPYRPPEYRKIMLPMTVLRRLDCVLAPTKPQVLATQKKWSNKAADALLRKADCQTFYNTSKLDFDKLRGAPDNIAQDLLRYIRSFSPNVRAIFNSFGFDDQIAKLDKANRLFLIVSKFAAVDLHPDAVPNHHMGLVFEELVRKFNEVANEEAGDHFTPREVIKLMVNILFDPDDATLTKKGIIRTLYDPTCGTGGMLTTASERLQQLNPDAQLVLFGQDYNPEAYAICCADMLIKGDSLDNIKFGDVLGDGKTEDGLPDHKFNYMLANRSRTVRRCVFQAKPQTDADGPRADEFHHGQGRHALSGRGPPGPTRSPRPHGSLHTPLHLPLPGHPLRRFQPRKARRLLTLPERKAGQSESGRPPQPR